MGRDAQVERISVVMIDVARIDAGLARLVTRTLLVPVRTVMGRIAPVGMVEVEPTHLVVMIRRSMHVRGPGHEAESQIRHAATKREDPAHPADCIRRQGATKGEQADGSGTYVIDPADAPGAAGQAVFVASDASGPALMFEKFSKMVHDPSVRNPWIVASERTQALLDAAWAAARR